MRSRTSRALSGSRPEVGSSSRTTSGLWRSVARQRHALLEAFRQHGRAARPGRGRRSKRSSASSTLRAGIRQVVQPGVDEEIAADGEPVPEAWRFGQEADALAETRRRPARHHLVTDADLARRWRDQSRPAFAASWSFRRRWGRAGQRPLRARARRRRHRPRRAIRIVASGATPSVPFTSAHRMFRCELSRSRRVEFVAPRGDQNPSRPSEEQARRADDARRAELHGPRFVAVRVVHVGVGHGQRNPELALRDRRPPRGRAAVRTAPRGPRRAAWATASAGPRARRRSRVPRCGARTGACPPRRTCGTSVCRRGTRNRSRRWDRRAAARRSSPGAGRVRVRIRSRAGARSCAGECPRRSTR